MKNRYNTKQRENILNYLKENKDTNVTADEILNHFQSTGNKIGKATVYRFLNSLVEEKVIKKYMLEDKKCSCYQFVEDKHCDDHYHLKCEKCNKIIHLECEEFHDIQKHIAVEHNFELDSVKTVLYGVCENCKASHKKHNESKKEEV